MTQRLLVEGSSLFLGSLMRKAVLLSFLLGRFGLLASCTLFVDLLLRGRLSDTLGLGFLSRALLVGFLLRHGRLGHSLGLGLLSCTFLFCQLPGGRRLSLTLGFRLLPRTLFLGELHGGRRFGDALGLRVVAGALILGTLACSGDVGLASGLRFAECILFSNLARLLALRRFLVCFFLGNSSLRTALRLDLLGRLPARVLEASVGAADDGQDCCSNGGPAPGSGLHGR